MKDTEPGFSPRLLAGPNVVVSVPHGVPAHGMNLFGLTEGVQVSVLPVCAIEDMAVSRWLGLDGIYRVEDMTGRARIGQGNIADRVRRHRRHPTVLPVRLVGITALKECWTFGQRCYLEEQLATDWIAQGFGLASTVFGRKGHRLSRDQRIALDLQLVEALWLVRLADRIIDRDADELTPVPPDLPVSLPSPAMLMPLRPTGRPAAAGETIVLDPQRSAPVFRRFASGTELMFTDGRMMAHAVVGEDLVTLVAGSTVHLTTSPSTGKRFAGLHAAFLDEAHVSERDGDIGQTGRPVGAVTAAQLIKLATGGRVHNGNNWRAR